MFHQLRTDLVACNGPQYKRVFLHLPCSQAGITTQIKTPGEAAQALRDPDICWLKEVRKMRGRVIYLERGRDSSFLSQEGDFIDADPFDGDCYHVLLRAAESLVACARVSLVGADKSGMMTTFLGKEAFEQVLNRIGTTWTETCEASRWMVSPEYRNLGLGPRVVAAAWALAKSLGLRTAFVLAGTRHGQDRQLCRMGAQPVPGFPVFPAGHIADDIRLLKFDIAIPAEVTRKKIERARMPIPLQIPLSACEEIASDKMRSKWPC